MGEQRKRGGPPGWLVAIVGLLGAGLLGWGMMAIGERKLEQARKMTAESEGRLMTAVAFAAQEGTQEAQAAQIAVTRSNWGEAGSKLARVGELVALMEQITPESQRGAVSDIRGKLGDAQRLVGEQSRDAGESLNALVGALDALGGRKAG